MSWLYMVTELLRGSKGKRRRKNLRCHGFYNLCMCSHRDLLPLAKFTRVINQLYWSTCNTLHFKKSQTPLPLGNLTVYHAEVFSSQTKLLGQTSKTAGVHILWAWLPKGGREILIFLVADSKSALSLLHFFFYLLSLYLFAFRLERIESIWIFLKMATFFLGLRYFQKSFGFWRILLKTLTPLQLTSYCL